MGFGSIAKQVKEKASKLADDANEALQKVLDEFNEAIPTIKAVGLSVKHFRIGMGVLPEIEVKIAGSLEDIDLDKVQELIDSSEGKTTLTTILKGLHRACEIKERIGELVFSGVEVDAKPGIPPKVSVSFV